MPYSLRGSYGSSGPLVDVWVGVSYPNRAALTAAGLDYPPDVSCSFIVDTGADSSMVSTQTLRALRIPPRGSRTILTATGTEDCDTCPVSLRLRSVGDPGFEVRAIEVVARSLLNLSIDGILGRDFLDRVRLRIDGPSRRFEIEWL